MKLLVDEKPNAEANVRSREGAPTDAGRVRISRPSNPRRGRARRVLRRAGKKGGTNDAGQGPGRYRWNEDLEKVLMPADRRRWTSEINWFNPRVTVGIRTHVGAKNPEWLNAALASFERQTWKDFSICLLIDGRFPDAYEIAKPYGLPFLCSNLAPYASHMSYLHRLLMTRCDSEYYKPFDYDDALLPEYFAMAVPCMDEKKLDHYSCEIYAVDQFGSRRRLADFRHLRRLEHLETDNMRVNPISHPAALLRTRAVLEAGGYAERCRYYGEDDWDLWRRMHQLGQSFHIDRDVRNAMYRMHRGSTRGVDDWREG